MYIQDMYIAGKYGGKNLFVPRFRNSISKAILLQYFLFCFAASTKAFYHTFVRNTFRFACVINEEVPDPYQCPGQITGYFFLRR